MSRFDKTTYKFKPSISSSIIVQYLYVDLHYFKKSLIAEQCITHEGFDQ